MSESMRQETSRRSFLAKCAAVGTGIFATVLQSDKVAAQQREATVCGSTYNFCTTCKSYVCGSGSCTKTVKRGYKCEGAYG